MKTTFILLTASFLVCSSAFAHGKDMKNNPCTPLFDACESAGFMKDGAAGKDLWDDCKKPLIDGKIVAGVTVNESDIAKCKKFKEAKKAWESRWEKNHSSM